MAKATLFDQAQEVKAEDKKKSKKPSKEEVQISGLENLAALDMLEKTIKGLKESAQADVKEQISEHFAQQGTAQGKRPANFKGIEGSATASCELRKRSTRSTLSEDEIEFLEQKGVTFETVTDQEECFRINPAYTDNQKLLAKVSEALEQIDELPNDFIEKQPAKTRQVVNDKSVEQAFEKANNEDEAQQILEIVSTIATKPNSEMSAQEALDKIREMISSEDEG